MRTKFTLTLVLLLPLCSLVFAQTKAVKGRVTDNTHQTLIGVSILLKGTKTGSVTDAAGQFQIRASKGDILVFSYLGFQAKEVPVDDRETYEVTLNPADNQLNEAVVIGYQTITRKSVTTAVSSVGTKDIAPTTTSNVADAIQGKVPGLQVFQGAAILARNRSC
ncbi:carboxypeptidase-like regulatory domain-containing protein [Mucilaginibacter sp. P25]|uniref:carboxypeptidase-like regulatory domain-containing protein n=1 Tax=unclassified Mucilaginibacter TaxID=2617802 RepID=UPI003D67758B